MSFTTDAESVLREKLKVALQDAKKLYDDGLVDEREFKDLKAHELGKYKEQLSAVTASNISNSKERIPQELERPKSTPTGKGRSPMRPRPLRDGSVPSPESLPSFSSPSGHGPRPKFAKDEAVYVDADTYKRLTTPPIFRRRTPQKRKIVIPCAELAALQGHPEENKSA